MSQYQAYTTEKRDRHFGVMTDEDEKLHPVPADAGFEWTETNMFGFNIPEHDIDCLVYLWHHPALGVTSGGVTIWKGIKQIHVEAEAFDFRSAMPMPDDPTDATYPNGLTVRMVRPQEEFEVHWRHPSEDSRFTLRLTAAMPPAVRYSGNHLTQMMRTAGELVLEGERYPIDGLFTRDRSWREHRSEAPMDLPPLGWMVGTFTGDFAFHVVGFESADRHPEWTARYPDLTADKSTLWGYVRQDGRTLGVDRATLHVDRGPDGLVPERLELEIFPEGAKMLHVIGELRGLLPQPIWPNMFVYFAFMRWHCDGQVGYGDLQQVTYGPHMRRARGRNVQ